MGDKKSLSHNTTHQKDFTKTDQAQGSEDKAHNEKLSNFLKKESFKIGTFHNHLINQKTLANFYTSVYKNTTDLDRIRQGKPALKADCDAHVGSVNLGSFDDKNLRVSEN